MKITCMNCGAVNDSNLLTCRICGAPIEAYSAKQAKIAPGRKSPDPVFRDGLMIMLTAASLIGFGPLTGIYAIYLAARGIQVIRTLPDPKEFQSHQAVCIACLFISLFATFFYGFIFLVLL